MSDERKLGKGLESIFGSDIDNILKEIESEGNGSELKIDEIKANPYQPRKNFNEEALNELAQSIKQHGVFQPILVRKAYDGYELVAGERRLRAAKLAGLETIPAIVSELDERAMMEISLLENTQREDLSAIEEAQAYQQLIQKLNYTQEELASRVNKSRTYVTNSLRLLKLPNSVQELVKEGRLSQGQARTLLALDDDLKIVELANKAKDNGLTVRQLEKLTSNKTPSKVMPEVKDPYLESVRIRMQNRLQTSVQLNKKNIVINYNDTEDLNRILEALGLLENSLSEAE